LSIFIAILSKLGISDEDLAMMTKENPAKVLGLSH